MDLSPSPTLGIDTTSKIYKHNPWKKFQSCRFSTVRKISLYWVISWTFELIRKMHQAALFLAFWGKILCMPLKCSIDGEQLSETSFSANKGRAFFSWDLPGYSESYSFPHRYNFANILCVRTKLWFSSRLTPLTDTCSATPSFGINSGPPPKPEPGCDTCATMHGLRCNVSHLKTCILLTYRLPSCALCWISIYAKPCLKVGVRSQYMFRIQFVQGYLSHVWSAWSRVSREIFAMIKDQE